LVATIVNVYVTPFVNPVTVIGEEYPVITILAGVATTLYDIIGLPPLFTGAVKNTVTAV
jgi:hypothetical protein